MELEGMGEVQRNLQAAIQRMHAQAAAAADETAHFLESTAKGTAPFKDRTEFLRGSIDGKSEPMADGYRMILSANTTYAPFVELGTRRSRPYAFIWPTVAENVGTALDIFRKHLNL